MQGSGRSPKTIYGRLQQPQELDGVTRGSGELKAASSSSSYRHKVKLCEELKRAYSIHHF